MKNFSQNISRNFAQTFNEQTVMIKTLSPADARKLALLSQWLPQSPAKHSCAVDETFAALRHLGYIQIDTISVIARAHHHTLWNRAPRYRAAHLDELARAKKVFEYWSHAAAYVPMEDYRFCLPQMHAYANGLRHWYKPDPKLMKRALQRIAAEGPLRSRDFSSPRAPGFWEHKPAKQALEQLFMEGKLMVLHRDGFNKVYDLPARVLPARIKTAMPSAREYARFLIARFLRAHGLGTVAEISYLRRGVKNSVQECAAHMARRGELAEVLAHGQQYYALPDSFQLLHNRLSRASCKILSPFDNLVIQRERLRRLFNFDYQIECYTPAAKRKHGYFSLPVLWDAKLVARMDCKAARAPRVFMIRNFVSEEFCAALPKHRKEKFAAALAAEVTRFAEFHECETVNVENVDDKTMNKFLRAFLRARR